MGGEESAEFYWLGEKKRRILTEEFLPENRDKRLALYPGRKRNRRDLKYEGGTVCAPGPRRVRPWGVRERDW